MESIFGVRRRTRRLVRAGLETLRDIVDARMRHIDEKRRRLASHRAEAPSSETQSPPRRRGRPRKAAAQ